MKAIVIDAFRSVSQGYSADRVIADPELNGAFLAKCKSLGLAGDVADLNRTLLNLRKQGEMKGPRSARTSFDDSAYRFAAEMAIRFLERRDKVTLDDVMCNPTTAAEFDALAASIAPGYSPLQYRWAALTLRKAAKLTPEILAKVVPPTCVNVFRVDSLNLLDISTKQGLYIFFNAEQPLYIGESENLRSRISKHVDHSDNKHFARWLWERSASELHLEIQILPDATETRIRKALELELIRSRNPVFNVKR